MDSKQYKCAVCPFKGSGKVCVSETGKGLALCPTLDAPGTAEDVKEILETGGDLDFYLTSLTLKGAKMTRIMETIDFTKKMGYTRVGLPFCSSLSQEAKIITGLFESHGLEVVSAICKVGRNCLADFTADPEAKDKGVVCNPVQQAQIVNEAGVDYNVLVGLCVGHDSLFMKYTDAMSTVLVAKDRVLGHNPLAAIYTIDSFYGHLKKAEI